MTLLALKSRSSLFVLSCALSSSVMGCDADAENRTTEFFGTVSVSTSSEPHHVIQPFAAFYRVSDQPDQQGGCYVASVVGSCRIWRCDDSAYAEQPTYPTLDPGRVRVLGGAEEVELIAGEDGSFSAAETPVPWWQAGDRLNLVIDGSAEFPSLDVTLSVPAPLTVTQPVAPEPVADPENPEAEPVIEPVLLDKLAKLPVAWSGPSSGAVYLVISPETRTSEEAEPIVTPGIDCEFAASAAEGAVPAEVLQALPVPDNLTRYMLDVVNFNFDVKLTKNARLDFRATWMGLSMPVRLE